MGSSFEGVIVIGNIETIKSLFEKWSNKLKLTYTYIERDLLLISDEEDYKQGFKTQMEGLAQELSKLCNKSLLIRYSKNVDISWSYLFVNGVLSTSFEENDELYSSPENFNENLKFLGGKTYTKDQLGEKEYILAMNGVQLGLKEFGVLSSYEKIIDYIFFGEEEEGIDDEY